MPSSSGTSFLGLLDRTDDGIIFLCCTENYLPNSTTSHPKTAKYLISVLRHKELTHSCLFSFHIHCGRTYCQSRRQTGAPRHTLRCTVQWYDSAVEAPQQLSGHRFPFSSHTVTCNKRHVN